MTRITACLIVALLAVGDREAKALITGGAGNQPVTDPGWPKGAAEIFNNPGRIAWWEGPPFGGGEWHAECRGDARALSAVLAEFEKLDVKSKRVVLHDGEGHSFWLAPNREPEKLAAATINWSFTVWQPASWERLHALPVDLNPTDAGDKTPPSRIDVYVGGVRWADVTVPKAITVVDQRLEAHGFTPRDGTVVEGNVNDLSTEAPVAAIVRLQRIEPREKGGYTYTILAETKADSKGHWVLKQVPAAWVQVVVSADGFVPRIAGYARFDNQPSWQSYDTGLARSAIVSGRVIDDEGQPLAGVDVRLDNVQAATGGRYNSPQAAPITTGADGRFQADAVPVGKASIWVHKPGYCRPGLGLPITTPATDVELTMKKSSTVLVTVDFTAKDRPDGYNVEIVPDGGAVIGSYGGSGNIDARNQMTFKDVPPGRYTLTGQPNPGSPDQKSDPVTVDLKGGQTTEITLRAK
jgi:hypothetical protein